MSKFIIKGKRLLKGEINVSGNKNAILPIMAATVIVNDECVLLNVPRIRDVEAMAEILEQLGAKVEGVGSDKLYINTKTINSYIISKEQAAKLRASVLFIGPLFARFGKVHIGHPGGDVIGKRGIEVHLDALEQIGAVCSLEHDWYEIRKKKKTAIKNHKVFLNEPSVTATENILMASVYSNKKITIENAAKEPHVTDLIQFLNRCGADIKGKKTHRLTIHGKTSFHGTSYTICPDYLEVGTFAVLSALTGGSISIRNIRLDDVILPLRVLESMGICLKTKENTLEVSVKNFLKAPSNKIQANPYPGFPTDLMSPYIVLATQSYGETLFHDPMYESRMFFVDRLISMGAKITICDPHRVIVYGPKKLYGSYQTSPDIRAGIALVIAALIAEGESVIDHAEIVERGYEHITERLSQLGASIKKVE